MSDLSTSNPGPIIMPPPGFALQWEYPEDAGFFWVQDRSHFPSPVTPMFGALYRRVMEGGMNRAAEAYEIPVRARIRRLNSYIYMALTPVPASAAEAAARAARSEEKLRGVMARLEEAWTDKFMPEIQRSIARWKAYDLQGADTSSLAVHLNETLAVITRLYEIHFLIWFPFSVALLMFEDFYKRVFGDDAEQLARLLDGFDSKMLEGDRGLWELGREASPKIRKLIRQTPAREVYSELKHSPEGRAFRARFDEFLKEHGYRAETVMALGGPYWIEEPAPAFERLKEYLSDVDRDLSAELTDAAVARESTIARLTNRLASQPQEVRGEFDFLLTAAQEAVVLREDHTYWIDCRAMYEVRRLMLEFGRRFTGQNVIESPSDIFYLTKKELHDAAEAFPDGGAFPVHDLRALVAQRKADMERYRWITPPVTLGAPPANPLPDVPAVRALQQSFGN